MFKSRLKTVGKYVLLNYGNFEMASIVIAINDLHA